MSKTSDQSFVDQVMIVMGALVLFAIVIGILALMISDRTVGVSRESDAELRAAVLARIAPVGKTMVAGQDAAPAPSILAPTAAPAAPQPEPTAVAVARSGEEVYDQACTACHAAGIAGAPKLGDAEAWAPRIAQGLEVLTGRAINGYTGEAGIMPAKGGNVGLSDEEVIAAVEYMIAQ